MATSQLRIECIIIIGIMYYTSTRVNILRQINSHNLTHLTIITIFELESQDTYLDFVRCGSHQGGSPQNGLGDEWTCGTTLASAYVLRHLSAAWSQLQMKERKSEWK